MWSKGQFWLWLRKSERERNNVKEHDSWSLRFHGALKDAHIIHACQAQTNQSSLRDSVRHIWSVWRIDGRECTWTRSIDCDLEGRAGVADTHSASGCGLGALEQTCVICRALLEALHITRSVSAMLIGISVSLEVKHETQSCKHLSQQFTWSLIFLILITATGNFNVEWESIFPLLYPR